MCVDSFIVYSRMGERFGLEVYKFSKCRGSRVCILYSSLGYSPEKSDNSNQKEASDMINRQRRWVSNL